MADPATLDPAAVVQQPPATAVAAAATAVETAAAVSAASPAHAAANETEFAAKLRETMRGIALGPNGEIPDTAQSQAAAAVAPIAPLPAVVPAVAAPAAPAPGATVPPGTTAAAAAAALSTDAIPDTALDNVAAGLDVKAGTAFKFLRTEVATKAAALAEKDQAYAKLQLEFEKVKQTIAEIPPDVQERLQRYEQELAVTHIEATDEYKTRVAAPLNAASNEIAALAKKYDIPQNELVAALSVTDPLIRTDKLSELSASMNRLDLARFDRVISDIGDIEQTQNVLRTNASEALRRMNESRDVQTRASAAENVKAWTTAVDTTFFKLQEQMPLFAKRGNDAVWDGKVDQLESRVRNLNFEGLTPVSKAELAFRAEAFPLAVENMTTLFEENQAMAERLQKLQGSTPGAAAGVAPAAAVPAVASPDMGFKEAMSRSLGLHPGGGMPVAA